MTRVHLPVLTLLVGVLGMGGCGGSEPNSAGGGGTTGVVAATGGAAPSGTGGVVATGGIAQVGTGGTTGMAVTTASGGSEATGGTKATGGATGGAQTTGGSTVGVGGAATGGKSTASTGGSSPGGTVATGGAVGTGGQTVGSGGVGKGGNSATGGSAIGTNTGGRVGTGGSVAGGAPTGGAVSTAPCTVTASKTASVTTSGTGTHQVVVESNSDISCGTIYRPKDLGGTEKYPIFVWGEGACTRSGTSNTAAMGEIASHGYFVIADGPPSGGNCASIGMPNSYTDLLNMAKPLLDYVTWAIAENGKSCSAYYNSLDTTKVAADGFSCGGLMAEGTGGDSRMTAWGVTSSGLTSKYQDFYKTIHTPVKILLGGSTDVAYTNGESDYTNISALKIPIILFSKSGAGHGGDLGVSHGGDFTKVNLAWLNWQLKGDTTATGMGFLVGSSCTFCSSSTWEVKSKNLP